MDNSTRLEYLEAMGIDVWVSRNESKIEPKKIGEDVVLKTPEQTEVPIVPVADNWDGLQKQVAECEKCILSTTRTETVFGEGNIKADWMLISEAPSQNEDGEVKPFIGQADFLLTEMLRAVGLKRDNVYITNVIKCSVPDNKSPKQEELASCDGYLQKQIALVQPKIILAVGRVAAQALLKTKQPLSELRGVPHLIGDVPLVVVYHPAYLLRSLLEKRKAWQDLRLAMKIYQEKE